jgi:glycerol-1-phosphate dehydrogenase [NAD(P)+]
MYPVRTKESVMTESKLQTKIDPIYVGSGAIDHLVAYCREKGLNNFALIADTNTYKALGERVHHALAESGWDVAPIILEGDEVIADERYLTHVFVRAPLDANVTFLAVGSGTLTDITRFVSHRTRRQFISLPTAPSVDGFTSVGAPLVLNGVKTTILCQAPIALFADLDTLRNAPHRLIAAGFGDMIGKITSLADWKLGSLLWDEPFDESIYKRSEVGQRTENGVKRLMDALIESGLCMLDFGTSRPASGAEHHASHYWEMQLLQQHRPAILHGAKVGFALLHVAEQYAKIRALSRQEMMDRLESAVLPNHAEEVTTIRTGYGALADDVITEHSAFLNLDEAGYDAVKRRIADRWDEVQETAAKVPPSDAIAHFLKQAGAPTTANELGLGEHEIAPGFQYGHYLRNRFTVLKLSRVLGVPI